MPRAAPPSVNVLHVAALLLLGVHPVTAALGAATRKSPHVARQVANRELAALDATTRADIVAMARTILAGSVQVREQRPRPIRQPSARQARRAALALPGRDLR